MSEILRKIFSNELAENAIADLQEKYPADLKLDMSNDDVFKTARKTRTEMNKLVEKIDDRRKEAGIELKQYGDGLITQITDIYDVVVLPFLTENTKRKEKAAKEAKELAELLAKEMKQINNISTHLDDCRGKDSKHIQGIIEAVDLIETDVFHKDNIHQAIEVKKSTLAALSQLLSDTIASEKVEAEREKLRKQQAEADKKKQQVELEQKITNRIADLKMIPTQFFDQPSENIKYKINSLENFEITEKDFADKVEEVLLAKVVVIDQLTKMLKSQLRDEAAEQEEAEKLKTEQELINEASEGIDSFEEPVEQEEKPTYTVKGCGVPALKTAIDKKQEEVNQPSEKRLTIVDIESFLKWELTREKALNDFGYLLLSNDSNLEDEALDAIRTDFKTFTGS